MNQDEIKEGCYLIKSKMEPSKPEIAMVYVAQHMREQKHPYNLILRRTSDINKEYQIMYFDFLKRINPEKCRAIHSGEIKLVDAKEYIRLKLIEKAPEINKRIQETKDSFNVDLDKLNRPFGIGGLD